MTAELVAIREALNEIEKRATRKDKIVVLTLTSSINIPQKPPQTTSETGSHRRDNKKDPHTQTPKGDQYTNMLDPSTLRNRRQRKS